MPNSQQEQQRLCRMVEAAAIVCRRAFGRRSRSTFGILMYHRIVDAPKHVSVPTFNVTPDRLRSQLAGLLKRGFRPMSLTAVLDHVARYQSLPERVFVVTFDDGYENNYTCAFPILQELNIPATVFLATAYLDSHQPFPFDDWSAAGSAEVSVETWRPLSTKQCQEMQASGLIELGAHTHTHQRFNGRPADLCADLVLCQAALKEKFGVERATFAFPYGRKSRGLAGAPLTDVIRQAGLRCALTTENNLVNLDEDPFDWGRFTIEQRHSARAVAAKLDGWYTKLRSTGRQVAELLPGRRVPERARTTEEHSIITKVN